MNALDEREVRAQLAAALEQLDPTPPPLDELRARAGKRNRLIRWGGAGVLAVAAAAVVAVLVVVIPGGGGRPVQVASAPTRASLADFANAHHGHHVAGPYAGPDQAAGYFGAFSVSNGIVVAKYDGTKWSTDGPAITALGQGRWVMRLGPGPQTTLGRPTFAVRIIGGDITYAGSVIGYPPAGHRWVALHFGGCGHHRLCYPGTSEAYGHRGPDGDFVSVQNDCTPDCAAGTEYRVRWRWAGSRFAAVSEVVRPR